MIILGQKKMNLQTTWATALPYLSEPSSQTGFPPTMIFPSHSFFPPTSFIFEPCSGKTEINVWYNPVSTCFFRCTMHNLTFYWGTFSRHTSLFPLAVIVSGAILLILAFPSLTDFAMGAVRVPGTRHLILAFPSLTDFAIGAVSVHLTFMNWKIY